MDDSTRRSFLRDLSLGAAAFTAAGQGAQTNQMPGTPPSGDTQPQPSHPASIMAIAAHPGDAFFAMGLAVALQVHLGGQGAFLSLSLGERGSARIDPAQYGPLQRQAAKSAAHMLGARAEFLTYPDGEIPVSEEAKFAVCDLIRQYRPGIVVTHWRGSWHKDHEACYKIVNDAMFYAGLPALDRRHPPHEVGKLFFADNWEDANSFTADIYLDITTVFESWQEACAVFPMWRGENGFRYNDYYQSLAVTRGCLCNCKYAVALMSPAEQLIRRMKAL